MIGLGALTEGSSLIPLPTNASAPPVPAEFSLFEFTLPIGAGLGVLGLLTNNSTLTWIGFGGVAIAGAAIIHAAKQGS